mgnify:CR=1 FL=1
MALTYEAIATATATGSSATISFTSISTAYTDLRLVFCGGQSADTPTYLRFNNDSASNYWTKTVNAIGTSKDSQRGNLSGIWTRSEGVDENTLFSSMVYDIPSYQAAYYRVVQCRIANANNSSTAGLTSFTHGIWKVNNAVTQIDLYTSSGNWTSGSTATLYGILRA